jgi:hypothetical protein
MDSSFEKKNVHEIDSPNLRFASLRKSEGKQNLVLTEQKAKKSIVKD